MPNYGNIKLNVGGKAFITKYETLMSSPYFKKLAQDETPPDSIKITHQGSAYFFIDRDPEIFKDIMYYLRTWHVRSKDETYLKTLNHEAKFFGFDDLVKKTDLMLVECMPSLEEVRCTYHTREPEHTQVHHNTLSLDSSP